MLYQSQNPHGGDLYSQPIRIDFSANINPYGTPQSVKDAVIASAEQLFAYPDPYCRELVRAISDYEEVPESYIMCGNGAAELIFAYCSAIRPKKALILAPTFSEYENALCSVSCDVEHFQLKRENQFLITEDLVEAIRAFDGDLIMLCNPNNPTGQVIEPGVLSEIALLCSIQKMNLFIDECFLDLTENGSRYTMKSQLARWDHVFLLKAFTKSFALAGLRLGYCLCSNASLLQKMGSTVQPWNVSVPAQKAGVAALNEHAFLEKSKACIFKEKKYLSEQLALLGFEVIPSKTNFILFRASVELRNALLRYGISIRSCANYRGLDSGWYRTAVKLPEENRQLIAALKEIVTANG